MRTLDDLDVEGKRVLVRVDFNVPLGEGGTITAGGGASLELIEGNPLPGVEALT